MNDSKAFFLGSGVTELRRDKLATFKSHWALILHEYGTNAKVTCISDQLKGLVEVWRFENRGMSEIVLNTIEGLLTLDIPDESPLRGLQPSAQKA